MFLHVTMLMCVCIYVHKCVLCECMLLCICVKVSLCVCVCDVCIAWKYMHLSVFHEMRISCQNKNLVLLEKSWRFVLFFCPKDMILLEQPGAPISTIRVTNGIMTTVFLPTSWGLPAVWAPWGCAEPSGFHQTSTDDNLSSNKRGWVTLKGGQCCFL